MAADDIARAWSNDGRSLLVEVPEVVAESTRIDRVDLATGVRMRLRELKMSDRAGLLRLLQPVVVDDGRGYAYQYWRRLSRLFVVRGVS